MKTCKVCNTEKELCCFYKHKQTKDGYLNKCKDCAKKQAIKNRNDKIDYYREYDKKRANLPHRIMARVEYQKTDSGKISKAKAIKKYRKNNPDKLKAHNAINNAIRDGKVLKPSVCSICGIKDVKIHGHHYDYNKPLDVVWCCEQCHAEIHRLIDKKAIPPAL